ncbi:MAG: hypothetical protein HY423_09450 [Candidatus Lambdaproteobacteria bacterium]|nr:hypothetical protein [Candidatus Lambdaproteobacteria bacterium]
MAQPQPRVAAPPKFGFREVERCLARLYRAARQHDEDERALDRRVLLAAACRELGADEPVLLRRGFDRVYRRLIEGV